MTQPHANPYHASDLSHTQKQPPHRWLKRFAGGACVYYILSAVTLPFANKAWIGEIPVFVPLQLPKTFIKSVIHDVFLRCVRQFGWSNGSASPDYRMIHPWAMTCMLTLPALLLIGTLLYFASARLRTVAVIAILACASVDAIVTLGFDAWSGLKIYNASFSKLQSKALVDPSELVAIRLVPAG